MPDPKPLSIDVELSKAFISLIQRDKNPLSHPEMFSALPFNYTTERAYTATNLLHLMMKTAESETPLTPCWVTMDVVKDKGAHFDKEDSTRLQFWQKTNAEEPRYKTYPLKNGGKGITTEFSGESYELRTFYVVNEASLKNLDKPLTVNRPRQPQPEKIQEIIDAIGVTFKDGKLFKDQYAFYFTKSDSAVVPKANEKISQASVDLAKLEMSLHGLMQTSRGGEGFAKPFPTAEEDLSVRLATLALADEAGMDLKEAFKFSLPRDKEWKEICERQPSFLRNACKNSTYLIKKAHQLQHSLVQSTSAQHGSTQDKAMNNHEKTHELRKRNWTGEMVVLPEKQVGRRLVTCAIDEAKTFGVYGRLQDKSLVAFSRAHSLQQAEELAMKFGALRNPKSLPFTKEEKVVEKTWKHRTPTDIVYVENVYSSNPEIFKENKAFIRTLKGGYDPTAKQWYVPKNTPEASLALFKNVDNHVHIAPEEEFRQALVSHGFDLERHTVLLDGQLHRCPLVDDKSSERSGAYIYHPDGRPAGMIQNFRTGEKTKWHPTSEVKLSEDERRDARKLLEAQIAKRKQEQAEQHEKVAKEVSALVEKCTPSYEPTPYLSRKGFTEEDLKLVGGILVDENKKLIVPIRDETGKIWSYQKIEDNGFKSLAKGGKKSGNFAVVGQNFKPNTTIICEGYATGLSIAIATRQPVVVAMDAGNLMAVAKKLKVTNPNQPILICGDDDRYGERNQGREKAQATAQAVGGLAVFPVFTTVLEGQKPTDFNDLAQLQDGRDQAEFQLMASLADLHKERRMATETPVVTQEHTTKLSR